MDSTLVSALDRQREGDLFGAAALCCETLAREPDNAEALRLLGLLALQSGDAASALALVERLEEVAAGQRIPQPPWDGGPLEGRTILVRAGQGLGDAIQYARYLPLLKARGGKVLLECPRRLAPLLAALPALDGLLPPGAPPAGFDVHASLLSLPRLLGASVETTPVQAPYLAAPAVRVQYWGRRLAGAVGRRVGLVWASNPASPRSIPIEALAPLASCPGLALFALQRDAPRTIAELGVVNLEEDSGQLTDTAAAMMNLDLVISIDTLAAHLAGALARPVWLLLPFAPDVRWPRAGSDSRWYPTMRLFRQPRPGDWTAVVSDVVEALKTA